MPDSENIVDAGIVELTGKLVVVAVLLLLIVVFVFSLHLYGKYVWHRRPENPNSPTRRDFAGEHPEIAVPRRGLDPSLLKTLPVLIFDPKTSKDGLECSVCLSEISAGEQTRLLPKCNHGFHLGCIDMWFESHSTCPLCRNPIENQTQSKNSGEEPPPAVQAPAAEPPPNFPTNVLIWGNETQVSTSALCVEEAINVEPSSSSSMESTSEDSSTNTVNVHDDDEHKSPMAARLMALKGLLGYNNRRINPKNMDPEQGC